MQVIDNVYFKGVKFNKNTNPLHDLKTNFDKILPIVNQTLADQTDTEGNLQFYPNPPKLSDTAVISLALLQEALSIDSEHWLWSKLQADYDPEFAPLPDLSRYNRRRKRLSHWVHQITRLWADQLCPYEDTFLVDSIPVLVAHIAREHSTTVCREAFHTAPG